MQVFCPIELREIPIERAKRQVPSPTGTLQNKTI